MTQTIFERLKTDHDKQRTLLRLVSKTHGDSRGRQELFGRLTTELRVHARAEERTLYSRLLQSDNRDCAAHSVAEHEKMRTDLEQLSTMDYSNPNWVRKFDEFRDEMLHHLKEEEESIFVEAAKILQDGEMEQMALTFDNRRDDATEALSD